MTSAVRDLLNQFVQLSELEQREAAREILRRTAKADAPSLSDAELVSLADELFVELDQREAAS